ncbi:MAG: ABC transporter permease [Candidatus Odinarchaeota archaeon]
MFRYAIKRVIRSYRLFIALTIGVLLATTFFASTNVAADLLSRDALNAAVEISLYDFDIESIQSNWTVSTLNELESELVVLDGITGSTHSSRLYFDYNNTGVNMTLAAIEMSSDFASNIQVIQGSSSLGPNETYVVRGSLNESLFSLGEVIDIQITVSRLFLPPITIHRNLTIAGYIDLPQVNRKAIVPTRLTGLEALIAGLGGGARGFITERPYNILLSDWNLVMNSILEETKGISNHTSVGVTNSISLKIDRMSYINPYDISNSLSRISGFKAQIIERSTVYNANVYSNLETPLSTYQINQIIMSLQFLTLSLPIFLLSYFTGTMVSDVGYNFRRREIGLLLTKGYESGTIRRMFLVEGALIGAIAGGFSIFLGTAAAYLVLGVTNLNMFQAIIDNSVSVVLAIILGMFLGLLSVWRPSGRASKLEILDALKQYIFVEETSEYKKLLPTVSFLLGTYKLIVWTLGIDMNTLLGSITIANLFVSIAIGAWLAVDGILNTIGPLLFLYGATKVFIRGSQKFQETVMSLGRRFFGAFGTLATRNVKRHPARNATLVFIAALIVSYGIYATSSLFSQYDYTDRTARYNVGADVRLELTAGANVTHVLQEALGYQGVQDVTTEYTLNLRAGTNTIDARGIRPDEWRNVAFWEPEWFIGDANQMFNNLDNESIILSSDIAHSLGLSVGDTINFKGAFSIGTHSLKIVGLVGYLSTIEMIVEEFQFTIGGTYTSFVSEEFLNSSLLLLTSTANVLIDTTDNTNGTQLQEQLINDLSEVYASYSVTTELADYQSSVLRSGTTKIQWLAITFAVILAMVGTALVVILTLQEKDAEIALLSVRGFSKWQLFKTLLAEVMVTVLFALFLGILVGYIENLGQIASLNGNSAGLIRYRMALGGAAGNTILILLSVVLLAAIIPVWWASRRPESKIDLLRV